MPADEGHPHALAAVFHQVLKVQFAERDEVLLHLRRAAGVALHTEAQVLTCGGEGRGEEGGENRRHQFSVLEVRFIGRVEPVIQTLPTDPSEEDQAGTNSKEEIWIIWSFVKPKHAAL